MRQAFQFASIIALLASSAPRLQNPAPPVRASFLHGKAHVVVRDHPVAERPPMALNQSRTQPMPSERPLTCAVCEQAVLGALSV